MWHRKRQALTTGAMATDINVSPVRRCFRIELAQLIIIVSITVYCLCCRRC